MRVPRNLPFLLRLYLIVGGVIIVASAIIYNTALIRQMRHQSERTATIFARAVAIALRQPMSEDTVERAVNAARESLRPRTSTRTRTVATSGTRLAPIKMGSNE